MDKVMGAEIAWLAGGGSTGALIRSYEWEQTPLGRHQSWPHSLKTLIAIILGSKQPMFVAWGEARTLIYNDAYSEILAGKHPAAMAQDFLEVWSEISADLMPIVDQAYRGEPVQMDDITLFMDRKGFREEAHFSFFYSPVRDEQGGVAGFFCACTETTDQIMAERRAASQREGQRLMLQRMPGFAALLSGPDHRFDYVNDAYVKLAGSREFVGRTAREAFPELEGQGFFELLDRVYATGEPYIARALPVRLAGAEDERFLDFVYHPVRDDHGRVAGIFAGGYDVTERLVAEQALRDAAERIQLALEAGAIIGTWVWDVPANRFTADERFARSFGIDPERCRIGLALEQVMDSIHQDDKTRVANAVSEALGRGGPYRCEYRVRQHDGVHRWIEANGRVDLANDGTPLRFPGVLIDIEERRALEAERDRATALLRTFTDAVPGVAYAKDRHGRMLVANRGTTELVGKPPELYLGKTDLDFLDDKAQAELIMATDRRIMETGIPEQVEEEVRLADGSPAIWLSTKAPMLDEDGNVIGLIGSSVDITARRRAEAALRELNETLETRVAKAIAERELAEETLRQSQKLESMGQLTGGVAHDFNNLLTPIIGSLDMLQRRRLGDERTQRLIEGALQSAERAKVLVQRLLAFARRQPLQPIAVDVVRLVEGMAELVASTSGPRVKVDLDLMPDLPPVKADAKQLEMAILNLVVNARDAMPDGGRLTIAAAAEFVGRGHRSNLPRGHYVQLSVSDTGIGMDAATLNRAVEPFFSTKGIGKGTGLGLSMVHGLAAQLGGAVTIQSRPALGTCVELWLPVTDETTETLERISAPTAVTAGTVLLVDDEDVVRASTAEMLIGLGYRVVEAPSAERALEMVAGGVKPDLVITDHLMPGMTGADLARCVQDQRPGTPVLIISGYAENSEISPDLPRLVKPFRQSDLAACLSELPLTPAEMQRGGGN